MKKKQLKKMLKKAAKGNVKQLGQAGIDFDYDGSMERDGNDPFGIDFSPYPEDLEEDAEDIKLLKKLGYIK